MGTVHTFVDSVLLTLVAEGVLTSEDVLEAVFQYYRAFNGSGILWDLLRADTSQLTRGDFDDIALVTRSVERRGTSAKTAFVATDKATYSQIEKYIADATAAGVLTAYGLFSNTGEAKRWLLQK